MWGTAEQAGQFSGGANILASDKLLPKCRGSSRLEHLLREPCG